MQHQSVEHQYTESLQQNRQTKALIAELSRSYTAQIAELEVMTRERSLSLNMCERGTDIL